MCGFVGDIVGGVVDAIGSVVETVVDNALPIIETVAFDYFVAPGFGSLISNAFDIGANIAGNIATGIGHAAISAANGGNLASIAAAGLAPIIASPDIQKQVFGGSITGANGAINKAVTDVLGNSTIAPIVAGAVGQAGAAGIVAGVTGGDILKAATNAGLSSVVSQGLSKTWNTIKANTPTMDDLTNKYKTTYDQMAAGNADAPAVVKTLSQLESELNQTTQKYNSMLEKYQPVKAEYDQKLSDYESAKNSNDVTTANNIAKDLNQNIIPKMNDLGTQLNDSYKTYETQNQSFSDFLKQNKATIDYATPYLDALNSYQNNYNVLSNQIEADYSSFNVVDAIKKGDFQAAAAAQNAFNNAQSSIASIDQSAMVGHDLTNDQIDMLNKIYNAPDQAARDQLISQAKLNQGFADIMNSQAPLPTVDTNVTQPPTTSTTTTATTTPPPSTAATNTLTPFAGKLADTFTNAIKGGVISNLTGQVIGGITGTPTGPTTIPSASLNRPAQHVDVSTLTPFTGTLPANLQTSTNTGQTTQPAGGLTTPTNVAATPTVTPTATQPTTGGLNAITQPQNVVADTSTQTPAGGLQSTAQPQTTAASSAPKKVDVSTLNPVTDTNMLKNLGLQIG